MLCLTERKYFFIISADIAQLGIYNNLPRPAVFSFADSSLKKLGIHFVLRKRFLLFDLWSAYWCLRQKMTVRE